MCLPPHSLTIVHRPFLQLTGPIPTEIGTLKSLQVLGLHTLDLSGSLPSELGLLAVLDGLYAQSNPRITGSIPSEIAMLEKLRALALDSTKMSGTIPEELYDVPIRFFDLSGSNFSGTISNKIWNWTNLTEFAISNNHFSGTLPDIPAWSNLNRFQVNGNVKLTGSFPISVCKTYQMAGQSQRVIADCPSDDGGDARLVCPDYACCTQCCGTGVCSPME